MTDADRTVPPWVIVGQRLFGYHCTMQIRMSIFIASVSGHVGSTDWAWSVGPMDRASSKFFSANGGSHPIRIGMTEEQAMNAALAALATAIYIDNL